ncbi:pyridoxal phosphate-dependent aminotransferase [Commensalibacter papalotli (ex Botero et al. 2024)]|uniref:Aminotransferase n=2 Tax=Commensalibacter papalotli (ex Botero et al. 2024) TaxID=2972766 RepID=A0ABM9HTV2_9PROT|nr:pyridoxal phosphate-dependent aminotransferase [Commensalibacter papalotli (ex Botero et al. 2024)]CAI3956349.1 Aspartate/methionine/tyrosine aminotransferase (AspB) (PDB:2O0R) [Commensalibacter papalotli (ex Botero et al. 2024)]CAI3956484.1 Aspartate/methionine/tyrosine aminotransferase (AspB) (PDB:2O0R) [Commensalibacter papalotli (ex Botero et al. 2024)]
MTMNPLKTEPSLSLKMEGFETPATIAMSMRARELAAQGNDVISLALGQPDFFTPRVACDAAYEAALDGKTKYPPIDGILSLKQAVQKKFKQENGLEYALDEIMVANGAKQILFNAFMATLNEGDEVVVPAPYWTSYPIMARFLGGKPVDVICAEENNFSLKAVDLRKVLTNKTKWLIINSPSNPTGAVWSRQDLLEIAEVLRDFPQVWIFADEIYEHLVFDGQEHYSLAVLAPDLKDRILTANGASKTYAMPGWRVGYVGGPKRLIKAMLKIQSNSTSGASSISQAAATAALHHCDNDVAEMKEAYDRRRKMMKEAFSKMSGVTCAVPQGAFYVYPGIEGCIGKTSAGGRKIENDQDFAEALLEEQHVAVVPGHAFGLSPYLRISYAADDKVLEKACKRIAQFVERLQ